MALVLDQRRITIEWRYFLQWKQESQAQIFCKQSLFRTVENCFKVWKKGAFGGREHPASVLADQWSALKVFHRRFVEWVVKLNKIQKRAEKAEVIFSFMGDMRRAL
jgi:hypothetical protein